jgi:putative nucleotidyltransferase with HDIG domain
MLTREDAVKLLKEKLSNKNLRKHCYAVEACMIRLAERFDEDVEKWGLAGLLHDLDYDETADKPDIHGKLTVDMLSDYNLSDDIINAILAHNHHKEVENIFERALFAVDPTTGFIVSCALMHPDKKISSLDAGFVKRRMGEKSFSRNVSREQMRSAEELGLEFEEFLEECISAMAEIGEVLGL